MAAWTSSFGTDAPGSALTYFHNEFTNGVEFVPQSALLALGLPAASDPAVQYGAAVNSQAFRAQGAEVATEYKIGSHLFARGGYTYLDAVVQRSFSSESQPGCLPPTVVDLQPGLSQHPNRRFFSPGRRKAVPPRSTLRLLWAYLQPFPLVRLVYRDAGRPPRR